jgi:cell division transport system ATP-binding protein
MATHDQGIVDRLKKRVVVLSEGKIVRDERDAGYKSDTQSNVVETNKFADPEGWLA